MELKIDKYVISKVPGSNLFDLFEVKCTKSGKTEGTTFKEVVGYGMSISKIVEVLTVQKVILSKSNEDIGGLLKELTETTVKIGEELKQLLKTP